MRMAEIVGAVVGVVHRRVDADRHIELDALSVERIVAPVAGGEVVVERRDAQTVELALLDQVLEFAHAAHAVERADRGQGEEAVRIFGHDIGQDVVVDAPEYRHLGSFVVELGDEFLDRLALGLLRLAGGRLRIDALAEDVPVVVEAVARTRRQQFGIAIADAVRGLLVILPRLALLVRRQQAFQIDDFPHHCFVSLARISRAPPQVYAACVWFANCMTL
jgi:hypothetical protein